MFHFKLVTPEGIAYEDTIESVSIPTETGEITVLEGHAALVSVIRCGEMQVHKKNVPDVLLAVSGGVVEVRESGDMYILADSAERAEHIDIAQAEAAKARAEELLLQQQHEEDVDFARIQAMIEKELARVSVAKKYRGMK